MSTIRARRVPTPDREKHDDVFLSLEPGDYFGPVKGFTDDKPAVFYRLPIELEVPAMETGKGLDYVVSPPHVFRECPDGSLEIRESILQRGADVDWHGYLDEGNVWRQV